LTAPALTTLSSALSDTFVSLRARNFRLFVTGQLVSNTGGWVQRIAQDWLVLTITASATAVGVTTALQFVPTLLLGLYGGLIADRFDKRTVLIATNAAMSALAALLAALTLSGDVRAWHVYVIAFALGLVVAVDNPTRQSFVHELVGRDLMHNAISLNSSAFQLGAFIGPAISGVLINTVGTGTAFAINSVSYLGPIVALTRIDVSALNRAQHAAKADRRVIDGVRYARSHAAVLWPIVLISVFGLFSINLPVTLAAYARAEFHSGASGYGLLSSAVALGALCGALSSARSGTTRLRRLIAIEAVTCLAIMAAAATDAQWALLVLLVAVGAATLLFLTTANSTVQLATRDSLRGRVVGLYLLVFIGSGAIGGPIVGTIDQHYGPRGGMLLAGVVPLATVVLVASRLGWTRRPTGPLRAGRARDRP
jgi:MFS family permease